MFVDGRWQIVYVDGIMAIDVATGYILSYGLKGKATRAANTEAGRAAGTQMSINGNDVRHLLLCVMQDYGLPPYLSTLLCEGATAKLNKPDEIAFLDLLKDRLEIDYTGTGRGQLLKSGFQEEWGRPGLKGWIESFFRLLHTSTNHLPGTTGRRYDMSRGDHKARLKYCEQLIKRAEKLIDGPLTPDHPLNQQLNFPIYSLDEVNAIIGQTVDQLNWRIKHKLQGFDQVYEWQKSKGIWLPESALDQLPAQERLATQLTPRMEAPAERLKKLLRANAQPFQRVPEATLAALYMEHRPATVRGGRITISDSRLGKDSLTFKAAELHQLDAYESQKEAVLAYIPDDYSHCIIADIKTGAHLATLQREGRIDITDDHEIGKAAGAVRREMDAELDHLASFLGAKETELANARQQNEDLLTSDQPRFESPIAQQIINARKATNEAKTAQTKPALKRGLSAQLAAAKKQSAACDL